MARLTRAYLALLSSCFTYALDVNTDSQTSLLRAAKVLASNVVSYYDGPASVVDSLEQFSWNESAIAWGIMIDYWAMTEDDEYLNLTAQVLSAQIGSAEDFQPTYRVGTLRNDDYGLWGLAVMSAAERGLAQPSNTPSWSVVAQNIFDRLASRWDQDVCFGGLYASVDPSTATEIYKNTASQGAFFQLAARLYRFTGNATYRDWADTVWSWLPIYELIYPDFVISDGLYVDGTECYIDQYDQNANGYYWSINPALFLAGLAVMSNTTAGEANPGGAFLNSGGTCLEDCPYPKNWRESTERLMGALYFAKSPKYDARLNVLAEPCESTSLRNGDDLVGEDTPSANCTPSQQAYKGVLAQSIQVALDLVPGLETSYASLLRDSALGVAQSCQGGDNGKATADGTACGEAWWVSGFDGVQALGNDASALSVMLSNIQSSQPLRNMNSTSSVATTPGSTVSGGSQPTAGNIADHLTPRDAYVGVVVACLLAVASTFA